MAARGRPPTALAPGGASRLRGVLLALLALAVVGVFVLLGFPYDALRGRLATAAARATGAQVAIGSLAPGLGLGGPRLVARDVTVRWPDGGVLHLERAGLRPAWSLGWLRGRPALAMGLRGDWGRVDGTAYLGAPGFDGRIRELDLDRLPVARWRPGADLDGTLDAALDLVRDGAALVGTTTFEARDGLVGLPELPLAVPYARLRGELRFGAGSLAEVIALDLEGPMLNLSLQGTVGEARILERAPLRLAGRLQVSDPAIRDVFVAQGIALDRNGARDFRVAGTLGAPEVR